ncbi:MAG: ABC transporter ATP-binding protein [Victivallaceae bacterium]
MEDLPILEVKNLSIRITKKGKTHELIDNLSFTLKKGRTLAIIGESGSGKSVAAQAILGLLPYPPFHKPQGEILYGDQNLLTILPQALEKIRGSRITMIFQNPLTCLNPVYTIGQQMKEVVDQHLGLHIDQTNILLYEALENTGITNPALCLKQYPHQLSGGMLQRVCIAMALICRPDILIADEPTTALDASVQYQILKLLKEIQIKTGMAILIITHNMGVVAEIADDVLVLYAGQHIEEASTFVLFDHISHPYTQALFAAQPGIGPGELPLIQGQIPHYTNFPTGCRFHPRCAHVTEQCRKRTPKTMDIGDKHRVKCWLYDK